MLRRRDPPAPAPSMWDSGQMSGRRSRDRKKRRQVRAPLAGTADERLRYSSRSITLPYGNISQSKKNYRTSLTNQTTVIVIQAVDCGSKQSGILITVSVLGCLVYVACHRHSLYRPPFYAQAVLNVYTGWMNLVF